MMLQALAGVPVEYLDEPLEYGDWYPHLMRDSEHATAAASIVAGASIGVCGPGGVTLVSVSRLSSFPLAFHHTPLRLDSSPAARGDRPVSVWCTTKRSSLYRPKSQAKCCPRVRRRWVPT